MGADREKDASRREAEGRKMPAPSTGRTKARAGFTPGMRGGASMAHRKHGRKHKRGKGRY